MGDRKSAFSLNLGQKQYLLTAANNKRAANNVTAVTPTTGTVDHRRRGHSSGMTKMATADAAAVGPV
jgi:hypothetical protein